MATFQPHSRLPVAGRFVHSDTGKELFPLHNHNYRSVYYQFWSWAMVACGRKRGIVTTTTRYHVKLCNRRVVAMGVSQILGQHDVDASPTLERWT